jgi:thioredoxin reductase
MTNKKNVVSTDWVVIGAGPAGIAAVGELLDHGVTPKKIAWIDPSFKVGDLGHYWSQVSSNTTVKLFNDFLMHCRSFGYDRHKKRFAFDSLSAGDTCKLAFIIEPLAFVTKELQLQVEVIHQTVEKIRLVDGCWRMTFTDETMHTAKNVILATGATPRSLPRTEGVTPISLYDALDPAKLSKRCDANDRVAVFGSSHSAVIILRELLEIGVKEVVNFYRQPLRFAVPLEDWILFDDTGLKGTTAVWARENLHGKLPQRLKRVLSSDENVRQMMPLCTKVIEAVGFNNRSPVIEDYPEHPYNPYNGIIAPGLFGIGIGFPESKTDPFGNVEFRVGLWKFISYLDRALPLWLKYGV